LHLLVQSGVQTHLPSVQLVCPELYLGWLVLQLPQLLLQPSAPHSLPEHDGVQTHLPADEQFICVELLPGYFILHKPQPLVSLEQPSAPHSLPEHFGWQMPMVSKL